MGVFVPLKKVVELDQRDVGLYAKQFSKLDGVVNIPFTLVISSVVFDTFIEYNNLYDLISKQPTTPQERVSFFSQVSEAFSKARFPQNLVNELKECFELVTLDTSDLSSLSEIAKKHSIISIKRSTSYLDGDNICSGTIYSKDDFIVFMDLLKSCYVSLFAPSSINYRMERHISDFSTAVVISRLPDTQTCFESQFTHDKMMIKSYVGFLDFSKSVAKDEFEVSVDFLKIEKSNIVRQETVCVFNLETNTPQLKQYVSGSSVSQSSPDTVILEIGRLTKRVASVTELSEFSLKAVTARTSQPTIVSLDLAPSSFEPIKAVEQTTDDLEGFDFEVPDDLSSDSTKNFSNNIITFLQRHQRGPLSSSVEIAIRSLENEVNKESLISALKVCQDIINTF